MSTERAPALSLRDLSLGVVLALIAAAVFLNTVKGEFVYDDEKQIVENALIQVPAYYPKALTSDVWAYKGGDGTSRARYWRPTFVAWLIVNHERFGLSEPPIGWHVGNIVLHALVTCLAFLLLRRLAIPLLPAAAAGLLFAVHPVHTESVAWISGSPDLLLGSCLLGSLLLVGRAVRRLNEPDAGMPWLEFAAAVLLYAIAQGAKEVAIFHAILVAMFVLAVDPRAEGRGRRAILTATPFVVVGVAYLIARILLLGPGGGLAWGHGQPMAMLTTAPALGAFYLRQIFFPIEIGPSYPVRPVIGSGLPFIVPLLVCGVGAAVAIWSWRRGPRERFLIAFFLLLLAPAANIRAFIPEQIVHDRYLYLPLLGMLGVLVLTLDRLLARFTPRAPALILAAAVVVAVPLTIQTVRYNEAWMTDLALWERGIETDPGSAFNRSQYAVYLLGADRPDEAMTAFNEAIAINPDIPNMYIGRADAHYVLKSYDAARADLEHALTIASPGSMQSLQVRRRIARTFEAQGRPRRAIEILQIAAGDLPDRRAAITWDIAIMLLQDRRPDEALMALESVRARAATEPSADARQVLSLLGELYRMSGNTAEARVVWNEFLDSTETLSDPLTSRTRADIEKKLTQMP